MDENFDLCRPGMQRFAVRDQVQDLGLLHRRKLADDLINLILGHFQACSSDDASRKKLFGYRTPDVYHVVHVFELLCGVDAPTFALQSILGAAVARSSRRVAKKQDC